MSTAHLTHGCGNSLPIKTGALSPHKTKIKNPSIHPIQGEEEDEEEEEKNPLLSS